MTEHERPIPHYFVRDGEAFVSSGLARNPWFANAVAGGPIAALIGQLIEEARFDAGLEICRLTIDILGVVPHRSEEHTSELQSLMRISYAVFCLQKKKKNKQHK